MLTARFNAKSLATVRIGETCIEYVVALVVELVTVLVVEPSPVLAAALLVVELTILLPAKGVKVFQVKIVVLRKKLSQV